MDKNLRDALIRHQILLMRLIRTQAKATRQHLIKAVQIIIEGLKKQDMQLAQKVQKELDKITATAMKLVNDVAKYEAKFTAKKLDVKAPTAAAVATVVNDVAVKTTYRAPATSIERMYDAFATTKTQQYMQQVTDLQLQNKTQDYIEKSLKEKTSGLFTAQNLALGGIAVVGVANAVRGYVSTQNGYKLQWSAILDSATCADCEDLDGRIFDSWDENEIPAHANCRCTWIVVGGDEEGIE